MGIQEAQVSSWFDVADLANGGPLGEAHDLDLEGKETERTQK
jgi:hypothetical protein